MSLDKPITFMASCDFCSETLDTDEEEFQAAIDSMKKEKWVVYKESGQWYHKCVCCQQKDIEDDFFGVS